MTYQALRETFGLAAQLAVRCISKVADAYKLDTKAQRTFQPQGAIPYDDRILSYNLKGAQVSIWTLDGRQAIPFVCGQRQRELLQTQRGQTDLALVRGKWYLFVTCDVETPNQSMVKLSWALIWGSSIWRPTRTARHSAARISSTAVSGIRHVV